MSEFKNLLNKNIDQMANIVSEEHGKTIKCQGINHKIEVVEFACGIPQLLKGEFSQNVGTEIDSSIRQPLGICCGITPSIFQQWFQCGCSNINCLWKCIHFKTFRKIQAVQSCSLIIYSSWTSKMNLK